jgi:hypothetical protein
VKVSLLGSIICYTVVTMKATDVTSKYFKIPLLIDVIHSFLYDYLFLIREKLHNCFILVLILKTATKWGKYMSKYSTGIPHLVLLIGSRKTEH